MNIPDVSNLLAQCFEWLLRSSWQGAILISAVLLVQKLLRRQLNARWRFNLWLLVLVRLVLPFSPESALSVFNYVKPHPVAFSVPAVQVATAARPPAALASASSDAAVKTESKTSPPAAESSVAQRDTGATPAAISRPAPSVTAPQIRSFTAVEIASLIWLVGVAGLSAQVARLMIRTRRQVRRATPIQDGAILGLFEECRNQMGVRASLRLLETDIVKSPALCGVARPALLLPPGLTRNFSLQELRYVFLHELAHVKRRDVALNWLLTALQILHWFNPVVWFGFARMRADRELACDALAISSAHEEEAKDYGRTIIKLLETLSRPSALPGLVGIMEDKNQMQRRIRMISAFKKTHRWSILALVVMGALAVTGLTDAVKPNEAKPTKVDPKDMLAITLVDAETGASLKDASVICPFGNEISDFSPPLPITHADDNGVVMLPRATLSQMGFGVLHSDYAPVAVDWQHSDKDNHPIKPEIPKEYTVKLDRGVEIGGVVVDEEGKPIPNVRVEIRGSTEWRRGNDTLTAIEYPFYNNYFGVYSPLFGACPVTDAEGRWRCSHFPKQIKVIELRLFQLDNMCRQFHTENDGPENYSGELVKMADLRNQKAELIMKKGIAVRGVVEDAAGKPVAGITLTEIDGRKHVRPLAVLTTGSDGHFELPNRDPHQLMLRANGPGFALNPVVVDIRPGMPEVRIIMSPTIPLRVRLVDENGKPIPKAQMGPVGSELGWRGKSSDDGRIAWNEAPNGPLTYEIFKETYGPVRKKLTPDRTEQTVTLRKGEKPSVAIVVKAQTQEKGVVESFTVFGVRKGYSPERIGQGKAGLFEGSVPYEKTAGPEFRLKIEAPGWDPLLTAPLDNMNGNFEASVTLRKAGPIEGVVMLPDGTPAARAQLIMSTEERNQYIGIEFNSRGRGDVSLGAPEARSNSLQTVRTDESGRFSFAAPSGEKAVIITHKNGFLETSLARLQESPEVRLEPWGRLEGTLVENGKPKADQRLELLFKRRPDYYLSVSYYISTDKNGYFVFDKVPPGDCTLTCTKPSKGTWPRNHPLPAKVVAGETTKIAYGSAGRSVAGKLRATPAGAEIDWPNAVTNNLLQKREEHPPKLPPPAYADFVRIQDYHAAFEKWSKSRAWADTPIADSFNLEFEADGSFHAEGIPPGTYELEVQITDPNHPKDGHWQDLGSIKQEVVVPAASEGAPNEVVNLGVFDMVLKAEATPKKPAAALTALTLDGKSINLADYRGKCVLLTFWSTWATPAPEELEALKATADAFGADPRFAMIGVALDDKPAAIAQSTQTNGFKWINARLEGRDKATATEAWGVDALPTTFLIGPEGSIVARNIKPARLRSAVEDLLKTTKRKQGQQ